MQPYQRHIARSAICISVLCAIATGYAATPTEKIAATENTKPAFRLKSGPPPGFADAELQQQQTTFVSVYYQGTFIGNTMATFDEKTLQFNTPETVISAIKNIKDKVLVENTLKGQLPTHQKLLCPGHQGERAFCHALNPKIAGVIFDASQFRAELYINPDYLDLNKQGSLSLPDSSSDFSALNANTFLVSGSKDTESYNINTQNIFAYRNNEATVNMSYTNTHTSGSPTNNQFNFQQFTAGRYSAGRLYEAGMVTPTSGPMLIGQPILGVAVKNYGVVPQQNFTGTPIEIYLPLASQVSIYRGNQLIGVQNLPAGKQTLDTRSLPNGAYNVTLKISDQFGQVSSEDRFFVKQGNIPDEHESNYQVGLGVLQKQLNTFTGSNNGISFPSFTDKVVGSINDVRRLGSYLALQSDLLTDFSQLFGTAQLQYFKEHYTISAGGMASNRETYGALLNGTYRYDRFSANTNILRIFNQRSDAVIDSINNDVNAFKPISTTEIQASAGAGYSFGKTSLSLSGSWTKTTSAEDLVQWGANISRMLISTGSTTLMFNASLTRADRDTTILAGVTMNFFTPAFSGNATVEYRHDSNDNNFSAASSDRDNVVGNAGLSKNVHWGNSDLSTGINYSQQVDAQVYSANLGYQSPLLQSQFNISHSSNAGLEDTTNYSGQIVSSFAYAHGHFNMGNNKSLLSGVMLDVEAPQDIPVTVHITNNSPVEMTSNHSRLVFLQPYQTYQVSIVPHGDSIYQYRKSPQIITLYQGNIQYVDWNLQRQLILFSKIVNNKGKALNNALLMKTQEFDTTDEYGYLQASIGESQQELTLRSIDGSECTAHIPENAQPSQGIVVIKQPLVCFPINKPETEKK